MYNRIGKYKILSTLGDGGMGTVYLGEHEGLRRLAAIKVMRTEFSSDAAFQTRFFQEARTMALLQHANIVDIYDMDKEQLGDGYFYYIAMEFVSQDGVRGRTLQDVIDELGQNSSDSDGEQSLKMFLKITPQIINALAYAHSNDILHCDIKPSNILIDKHGDIKLSDFGLAKVIGTQTMRDSTIGAMRTMQGSGAQSKSQEGTFLYMPPEVQDGGEWTKAGDVYSLGMVIYRMLTGKRPVARWKNPSETVKGLPLWCDSILEKCLSEREERYTDGLALLSDYRKYNSTQTITNPPKVAPVNTPKSAPATAPTYAKSFIGKLKDKFSEVLHNAGDAVSEKRLFSTESNYESTAKEEKIYSEAVHKMSKATRAEEFRQAYLMFLSVEGYKNASKLAQECKDSERKENRKLVICMLLLLFIPFIFGIFGWIFGLE